MAVRQPMLATNLTSFDDIRATGLWTRTETDIDYEGSTFSLYPYNGIEKRNAAGTRTWGTNTLDGRFITPSFYPYNNAATPAKKYIRADGEGGCYIAYDATGWWSVYNPNPGFYFFLSVARWARLDSTGAVVWQKDHTDPPGDHQSPSNSQYGALDVIPGSDPYVVGSGVGYSQLEGTYDISYRNGSTTSSYIRRFVARLDQDTGAVVWLTTTDNNSAVDSQDNFDGIAATTTGVYVAGERAGTYYLWHYAEADGTESTVTSWGDGTTVKTMQRAADGSVYVATAPGGSTSGGVTVLRVDGGGVTHTLDIDGLDEVLTISSLSGGQWVIGGYVDRTSPSAQHAVICGGTFTREFWRYEAVHTNPSDYEQWYSEITAISRFDDSKVVMALGVGDRDTTYTATSVDFLGSTYTSPAANDVDYLARILWLPSYIRQHQSPRGCSPRLSTWPPTVPRQRQIHR